MERKDAYSIPQTRRGGSVILVGDPVEKIDNIGEAIVVALLKILNAGLFLATTGIRLLRKSGQ